MPYWRLFYHFTWATKGRALCIAPEWEMDLHRAIVKKAQALGALVYAVGAMEDHVHLVASAPPKLSLATFVGQIKGNSSHIINTMHKPNPRFAWQQGYGVVSFGEHRLDSIIQYVKQQRKHHRDGTISPFLERDEPRKKDEETQDQSHNVQG